MVHVHIVSVRIYLSLCRSFCVTVFRVRTPVSLAGGLPEPLCHLAVRYGLLGEAHSRSSPQLARQQRRRATVLRFVIAALGHVCATTPLPARQGGNDGAGVHREGERMFHFHVTMHAKYTSVGATFAAGDIMCTTAPAGRVKSHEELHPGGGGPVAPQQQIQSEGQTDVKDHGEQPVMTL